jgi:hypothetical protein
LYPLGGKLTSANQFDKISRGRYPQWQLSAN